MEGHPPPLHYHDKGFFLSHLHVESEFAETTGVFFSRWKLQRFSLNLKSTIRKLLNCIFKVKVQIWSTPKRCEVAFVERSSVLTWREERFKAPLPPLSFCWWHQSFFPNKLYCVCVCVVSRLPDEDSFTWPASISTTWIVSCQQRSILPLCRRNAVLPHKLIVL